MEKEKGGERENGKNVQRHTRGQDKIKDGERE